MVLIGVRSLCALVVGRNIDCDIDDVALLERGGIGGESKVALVPSDQLGETRLTHWKCAAVQSSDQRGIGIESDRAKSLRGRSARRNQAEMRHPGISRSPGLSRPRPLSLLRRRGCAARD